MTHWAVAGQDLRAWAALASNPESESIDAWPATEHCPGFDPHGLTTSTIVCKTLDYLAHASGTPSLTWLAANRQALESSVGLPLSLSGVAAAALVDLGFSAKEGEMLYLLLRLPGAAVHALEQERIGIKQFPFYPVVFGPVPSCETHT